MKNLLLTLITCLPLLGWAQAIPEFQFTLYAEDTLGHRDSIVLGYDPTVQFGVLSPQFGETDITQVPFDSVFELRASYGFDSRYQHTKNRIAPWTCDTVISGIALSVRSHYGPFRLYWDQSLFQNTCNDWITLSDSPVWQIGYYSLEDSFSILSQDNEFVINNPIPAYTSFHNGGGFGEVYSVVLYIWPDSSLLGWVSTSEVYSDLSASVFPNPAREQVQVTLPDAFEDARTFHLFNAAGQVVLTHKITDYHFQVDLRQLPPGWYAYTATNAQGYSLRGKLILTE